MQLVLDSHISRGYDAVQLLSDTTGFQTYPTTLFRHSTRISMDGNPLTIGQ